MGVAVSGMHYTGMAAMHLFRPGTGAGMVMTGGGATAEGFLLPLLIGISILSFIMTATLALSPSDEEIRADAALLQRIESLRDDSHDGQPGGATRSGQHAARRPAAGTAPAAPPVMPGQQWSGSAVSRAIQARRQAEREGPLFPG